MTKIQFYKKTCLILSFLITSNLLGNDRNNLYNYISKAANKEIHTNPEITNYIKNTNWNKYWIIKNNNRFYFIESKIDYIKKKLLMGKCWEPHIKKLINLYTQPGSNAIEIGGHIGVHAMELAKCVGKNGQVIVFEPQIKLASELAINCALNEINNVAIKRMAVGNSTGYITMNKPNPQNEGGTQIGKGGDSARIIPLDSLQINNVSIIKIDVECSELGVLKGALNTIKRNRPAILLEIMGGYNRSQVQKEIQIIHKWFKQIGYKGKFLGFYDYLFLPK